ncbi:hypothetical protein O6H91_12G008600 [Diphasiastrum complanatum]|nr:hypothetical protein O6H91_12G008600 [Diphasiastrum complanatum]
MMARHEYPIDSCRKFHRTDLKMTELASDIAMMSEHKSDLKNMADDEFDNKPDLETTAGDENDAHTAKDIRENTETNKVKLEKTATRGTSGKTRKGDGVWKGEQGSLKSKLGDILGYGPVLCEHIILDAGLHPSLTTSTKNEGISLSSLGAEQIQSLSVALAKFEDWLESVIKGITIPEGYIFMQNKAAKKKQVTSENVEQQHGKMYDEFSPLILRQYMGREHVLMGTFDAAMDEFFSKIEGQRAEEQRRVQEDSALSKLGKIRTDQTNRVQALKREVDQSVHMAELIEYNLEDVDSAILAVRTALANGMDWKDLALMIKEEKKAGNPVAGIIHSLQLEKNQITLLLSNNLDEMDDEEKTQPVDKVEVDIGLSAHGNARYWFEVKKKQAMKQEKTVAAHAKAFKAAEKKTQQQLAQAKVILSISHIRKVHWFEKFNWFISSENYLVISGRDAQQNEILVKRYLKKGDLYVHADLHGASSTVVKNQDSGQPIPPLTINQAGCFTVCRSQAWDSKIVTSAWWVFANQVSKTAPTGEYLTVGSFMIRGKKNFLPPCPLVMGFGLLFRLDESSLGAHLNERRIRAEGEADDNEKFTMKPVAEMELDVGEAAVPGTSPLIGSSLHGSSEEQGVDSEDDQLREDVASGAQTRPGRVEWVEDKSISSLAKTDTAGLPLEIDDLLDKALQLNLSSDSGRIRNKYGLEDIHLITQTEKVNETAESNQSRSSMRERPYKSIAERRRLKKGGKQEEVGVEVPEQDNQAEDHQVGEPDQSIEVEERQLTESDAKDSSSKEVSAISKLGRGRKSKLKKIKTKYAEQDEEERQLRISLLASAGKDSKLQKDESSNLLEKAMNKSVDKRKLPTTCKTSTILSEGTAATLKICYKCKQPGHVASSCPSTSTTLEDRGLVNKMTSGQVKEELSESGYSAIVEMEAVGEKVEPAKDSSKAVGRANRRANAKAEEREIAALLAEENVVELDEDEKEKLSELDSLTGRPLSSDVLLYAVPVCGPYNAVQSYKYHVKLTPGAAKKGKAAKIAIDAFSHLQEVTQREKELIKAITEPELVASMIGNVKVAAPGLTKLQQQHKKGKKASHNKV